MDVQKKYEIIKSLVDHPDTANKDRAALILGCTKRHINRMIRGYKEYGKVYFIHGNRGRRPATAISDERKAEVIQLYESKYYDANFTHFTELLEEFEGIRLSLSSVSNILESQYILSPRVTRAKRKRIKRELNKKKDAATAQKEQDKIQRNLIAVENAHSRRPRCAYFGELQQMDATPYEWVPGQIWHLHLAIDDASGHCISFRKHYYRMLDKSGKQVHFQKGTKVIKAYDGKLYTCVNDRDIYVLEEIPEHAKTSKDLAADHTEPKPKKLYIPPMNHP